MQVGVGDVNSISRSGRYPRGGNDNPLQYSCLENPMDRGAWQAAVHRVGHDGSNSTHTLPFWKLRPFLLTSSEVSGLQDNAFLLQHLPLYIFLTHLKHCAGPAPHMRKLQSVLCISCSQGPALACGRCSDICIIKCLSCLNGFSRT